MKKVVYLCPNCFKFSTKVKALYSLIAENTLKNGEVKETENLEEELQELKFNCGCITHTYGIEDIEVIIDEIEKTISIFYEFEEYEKEIRKQNPEYKDYKIVWE